MGVPATGLLFFRYTILDVLGTGNIVAVLRHAGTQAEDSEMLKIVVNFFFANSPTQSLSTLPSTLSRLAAFLGLMLRRSHLMCGLTSPHVWSGLGQCHRRASTVVSVNCCLSRSEYRTNLSPQIRWHKYPLREMCSSYSPLLP